MAAPYGSLTSYSSQEQTVSIKNIQWCNERHTIVVGDTTIELTPTEYRLLYPLRDGLPVTYNELAKKAYQYKADEKVRAMMDKHIDRIRGKLQRTGIYVYCVLNYGYLLLPKIQRDAPPHNRPLSRTKSL